MSSVRPIGDRINQLISASARIGFDCTQFGTVGSWPLIAFTRAGSRPEPRQIYLSAGIHGDEPAGPQAILELLLSDALPRTHSYYICPVLNPAGLAMSKRENPQGIDLNRDYRDFRSAEIQAHAQWIARSGIQSLDLSIHLHEDWESTGFYLYELNFTNQPGYAENILISTSQHIPTETAPIIDGREAQNGIIRPKTLPEIDEGHPEAIYFQQKFGGINYTLETPSSLPIQRRVDCLKAAVMSAIN
jgi:Predicted deacylase